MSNSHHPIVRAEGAQNVIDCSCGGYVQEGIYTHTFGARTAFLEHLVNAVAQEHDWPHAFMVEAMAL